MRRGKAWRDITSLGLLLVGALTIVRWPPEEEPQISATPLDRVPVLWAGCWELRLSDLEDEPHDCVVMVSDEFRPRLLMWVPSRVSEPEVILDEEQLQLESQTRVDGGWSFVVWLEHGGRLRLRGTVETVERELMTLDVELQPLAKDLFKKELDAALEDPPARDALELRVRAQLKAARSPEQRLLHTKHLRSVLYDQGKDEASAEQAVAAAQLAQQLGQPLEECRNASAAAFVFGERLGQRDRAEEVWKSLCRYEASIPSVAMLKGYYAGMLELHQGYQLRAQRSIQRTVEIARRLRWPNWERIALNPLIGALASQGRFRWANQLLDRAEELAASNEQTNRLMRCKATGNILQKRGALAFREARLLGRPSSEARPPWQRARRLYLDRERCPDHPDIDEVLGVIATDLALVSLDEGDLRGAAQQLEAVSIESLRPTDRIRHRLTSIELAAARGEWAEARGALTALDAELDQEQFAEAMESEEQWRRQLLRARVYLHEGDTVEALRALALAEQRLDDEAGAIGAGLEADRRAAMGRQSGQLLVRLLREREAPGLALCAARVTRARGLVGIGPLSESLRASREAVLHRRGEAQEAFRWYDPGDIPTDELMQLETSRSELRAALSSRPGLVRCQDLPRPVEGELSLLWFDLGSSFIGFAWDGTGHVTTAELPTWPEGADPVLLGETLLAPFGPRIDEARRLRMMVPPRFHEPSIPDLMWHGRRIGDAMPVLHGVDLPLVSSQTTRKHSAALVFSDPQKLLLDDYSTLHRQFGHWAALLEAHGLATAFGGLPHSGAETPSVDEVLRRTDGVELALLYGFGRDQRRYYDLLSSDEYSVDPDQRGFDLGATELVRSDILLRSGQGPRHVILAHCNSAMTDPHGISGAIGLAQSYVQAGSDWALGTAGTVSPDTMERAVAGLIEAYARGSGAGEMAMALQQVKRRLRDEGLPDGEQLRLWVP